MQRRSKSQATKLSPTSLLLHLGGKGKWWEAFEGQQLQWGSLGCVQEEGVSPKPDEEHEHWKVLALYGAMEDAESVREREGKERMREERKKERER